MLLFLCSRIITVVTSSILMIKKIDNKKYMFSIMHYIVEEVVRLVCVIEKLLTDIL